MRLLNKYNLEIAKLCDTEESRYALSAVLVTDKETVMTNGHYLVRVPLPSADPAQFPAVAGFSANDSDRKALLPREVALSALKALPKKTTIPMLCHAALSVTDGENAGGQLAVTDLDNPIVQGYKEPSGRFPNFEAVIPRAKAKPVFEIAFDAGYLEKLAKLAKGYGNGCLKMSFYGAEKGAKFTTAENSEGQRAEIVLMPMRSS